MTKGRLRASPARVSVAAGRIAAAPNDQAALDRQREQSSPWRKWYRTSRWFALRKAVLLRDAYACRMCGRVLGLKGEAVIDHVKPHRGDANLFWSLDNLQVLCAPCHSSAKQREERRGG